MPLQLHRAIPPITPSRSHSSSSTDSAAAPADRASVFSFLSSSDYTAVSDHPTNHKILPALPKSSVEFYRRSNDYDPYATKHAELLSYSSTSRSTTYIHPLTATSQLAAALGPDNAPFTTEIDTLPCAGIRIPHGPLTGQLAWRMVVHTVPQSTSKGKSTWWGSSDAKAKKEQRRNSYTLDATANLDDPLPPATHAYSYSSHSYTAGAALHSSMPTLESEKKPLANISTTSLPLSHAAPGHRPRYVSSNTQDIPARPHSSALLSRHAHVDRHAPPPPLRLYPPNSGIAANFILDTSLPYSIISRDALLALGYAPEQLPPAHHDPHVMEGDDDVLRPHDSDRVVTLSIQNVTTRVRIARPGEASRLGVQFLKDAGVSLSFPGDGVGPILYLESSRLWRDIPRTITSLPHHPRGAGVKMTLPQRVRALFGLSS